MNNKRVNLLQIIVHVAGWLPFARILTGFLANTLTANPIQRVEQITGDVALYFLLLSLACTPFSSIMGWGELNQRRRALGNYSFLYAALHLTTYVALDYGLNIRIILLDAGTKPYIVIGLIAFFLLFLLAITSFDFWMKRLGKNWSRLHKLVYAIILLVIIHFFMVVKGNLASLSGNISRPLLFGVIAGLLMLLRIPAINHALIRIRLKFTCWFQQVFTHIKKE